MPERTSSFVKVDELLPEITLEQAANYYGVTLSEIRRIGDEIRMRCFLGCGRTEETGDRALAIQANHPAKQWKCHQYQCQKGGNLVGLCDLMKPGQNAGGRPRGQRFKEIAADLAAMVHGERPKSEQAPQTPRTVTAPPEKSVINVPLAQSQNERARELLHLDQQFVTDVAQMSPEASAYFRRRPFLTPEVCTKYRLGYLPHSSKSLLRGHVVYGYHSREGELLTWFGRNPRYEEQHARWKASDPSEAEPIKTRFVKGFQRGLELYGEHLIRSEDLDAFPDLDIVVVEGPNDAIRLQLLGVPAVALCSNSITKEQVERLARLAHDRGSGWVSLMLDCDEEGIHGSLQALPLLAERMPVRLAWSAATAGGRFKGRQPESLSSEEWAELVRHCQRGGAVAV